MRREGRRVSIFTVVLAVLVAAGLVGLIAWQAAPWLIDSGKHETAQSGGEPKETPAPKPPAETPPAPTAEKPSPTSPPAEPTTSDTPPKPPEVTAPAAPDKPQVEEPLPEPPKPVKPAEPAPERPTEKQRKTPPLAAGTQAVGIITTPSNALASLDGHSAVSCHTPCTLMAPPGRHFVEVTLAGYQAEHREIAAGNGPRDLAPIVMHPQGGKLFVASNPAGASITVNGKLQDKVTPAQLDLAPGSYNIAITRNDQTESRVVQIENGTMKTLRVDFRTQ